MLIKKKLTVRLAFVKKLQKENQRSQNSRHLLNAQNRKTIAFFLFIKHSAAEIRVKDSSGFMSRDKRFCVKDLLQAISVTTRFVLQLRTLSIVRNDAILLLRCIVGN